HPSSRPGLLWTDYWYLAGLVLTTFLTLNPMGWELADPNYNNLRHMALAISASAVALAILLGDAMPRARSERRPRPVSGPLSVAWPARMRAWCSARTARSSSTGCTAACCFSPPP